MLKPGEKLIKRPWYERPETPKWRQVHPSDSKQSDSREAVSGRTDGSAAKPTGQTETKEQLRHSAAGKPPNDKVNLNERSE